MTVNQQTTQPLTKQYKGVGIDGNTVSDSQVEQLERSYSGVVACRGKGIQDAFILFITASDEPVPSIPGIQFTPMFNEDSKPLGNGQ